MHQQEEPCNIRRPFTWCNGKPNVWQWEVSEGKDILSWCEGDKDLWWIVLRWTNLFYYREYVKLV